MTNDIQLKSVLANAIVEFCQRQCLYVTELTIQGTVCVTTDNSSILVTQIAEKIVDKRQQVARTLSQTETVPVDDNLPDEAIETADEVVVSSTPEVTPRPAWNSPDNHNSSDAETHHRDVQPPSSLPLYIPRDVIPNRNAMHSNSNSPVSSDEPAVVVKNEVITSPAYIPDFAALAEERKNEYVIAPPSPTTPPGVSSTASSQQIPQFYAGNLPSPGHYPPRKKARTNVVHTNIGPEAQRDVAKGIIDERRYKQYQAPDGNQFECPLCSQVYKTQPQFRVHLESRHVGLRIECDTCKVTFQSLEGLSTHRRRNHPEQLKHVCDICTERYYDYYALLQHKSRKHNIVGVTNRNSKKVYKKEGSDVS